MNGLIMNIGPGKTQSPVQGIILYFSQVHGIIVTIVHISFYSPLFSLGKGVGYIASPLLVYQHPYA